MADGDARSDDTGASGNEEDTERQSRRPCTHAGSIKVSVVKPLLLRFAKRCNGRLTGWMCTICGQWEAQRVCPHFGGKHCFVLELDTGNCWCYKCDRLVQDAGDVSSTKLFDRVSELSELWSAAKTIAEDAENAAALSQAISDSPPLRDEPSASGALSKSAKKKKDKRASDSGSAGGGPPPREAPDAVSTGPDRASAHLLPVRGLYNLGNTCFFNSVMQNLCVMHCLRDELARRQASAAASVGGQSLPQLQSAVLRFLQDMNSASAGKDARKASYDPGNLLAMAGRLNPAFRGRQQQDAHELLRTLLDGMRDEELEIERLHRRAAVVGIIRSWPPEEFERWRSSCCSLSLAREDLVQLIVTPASKASKALMKRFSEADRKSVSAALQTLLRGGADGDCDPAERSSDESDAPSGSDAGDSDADADADGKVDEDDEKSGGRSNVLVEPSALPSESKSDGDEGHLFSAAVAEPSADRAQLSISSLVQHADPSLAGTQQGHVEQGSGPCKQESAKTRKRRRREVSQAPVKKDTAVDRVFGGLLQSTVVCLRCGQASVRFEPFFDLSLPIAPPPSLATLGNSARKKKKTQAQLWPSQRHDKQAHEQGTEAQAGQAAQGCCSRGGR
jgi:ubiquitin C-terminal hydrolase